MADPSFDIVSKVDRQEVDNALNQTAKEAATRYDFKGTGAEIAWSGESIVLNASSEERVKALLDVFKEKLVKRQVSLKTLEAGEPQQSGKTYRLTASVNEGISMENAKKVAKLIRDTGPKGVQPQIQGDQLRVSAKKKDDLQAVIALVKGADLDFAVQFTNYRKVRRRMVRSWGSSQAFAASAQGRSRERAPPASRADYRWKPAISSRRATRSAIGGWVLNSRPSPPRNGLAIISELVGASRGSSIIGRAAVPTSSLRRARARASGSPVTCEPLASAWNSRLRLMAIWIRPAASGPSRIRSRLDRALPPWRSRPPKIMANCAICARNVMTVASAAATELIRMSRFPT